MITQQQAEKAVYLLKEVDHFINGNLVMPIRRPWIEQRVQLLDEIEANEPMTNGDKWRSMTDEQIAEIIQSDGCCACPVDERICTEKTQVKVVINEDEFNNLCKAAIVKWLKQEARND